MGEPVKKHIRTIDMTPSWLAVLPIYLEAYRSENPAQRARAEEELRRMAQIADEYNLLMKELNAR